MKYQQQNRNLNLSQNQNQGGFTLIELMVAVGLAAILLTIAVPSYTNFIQSMRMEAGTQEFVQALQFARAEAVRSNQNVTVTATDGLSWAGGLTIDRGATTLRDLPAWDMNMTNGGNLSYVFTNEGLTTGLLATDTVSVCDSRTGETGRSVTVLVSGIISATTQTCP